MCERSSELCAQADGRPAVRPAGARALADWLLRPDHPLTARVIVNRLWQHHFGRGLVGTSSDFGTMGDEPTHPELLDWLATRVGRRRLEPEGDAPADRHQRDLSPGVASHRGRAGPPTPRTLLLWRQNRQRLDGEAIRDALLAVSGRLNPAMGGPSVFPELPPELAELSSKGAVWPVSPGSRIESAAAFMSSSGATCDTRSSRSSTGPTPTRAARSGPSRRSRPGALALEQPARPRRCERTGMGPCGARGGCRHHSQAEWMWRLVLGRARTRLSEQ